MEVIPDSEFNSEFILSVVYEVTVNDSKLFLGASDKLPPGVKSH